MRHIQTLPFLLIALPFLAACDTEVGIALEESLTGKPSLLRTTPRVEFAAPVVAALEVEPVAVLEPEPPALVAVEICAPDWVWRGTVQPGACHTEWRPAP